MVLVDLALAILCFTSDPGSTEKCYPVLVGEDTPRGEYTLQQITIPFAGYGGDVLQFHEDDTGLYAIHRVYLLNPKERRAERLRSKDPKQRRYITKGCINVDPVVYAKLVKCCSTDQLVIK